MGRFLRAAQLLAGYRRLSRFRRPGAGGLASGTGAGGKIDVVYLWRDAHNARWVTDHTEALAGLSRDERAACNRPDLRYLEVQRKGAKLDLLRWSLRSLVQHFDALGRVYIVSDTPAPAWLDATHARLVWVSSRDVIADPCVYPSFSSQAIESFLYRLPGLSERFIYFNDDFFLSRPVGEETFFQGPDILVRFGRSISPKGQPDSAEAGDTSAHRNSNRVLDETFGAERRLTLKHRPYPLTRTLFADAEARFPEAFDETRRNRFRSMRTFALHSCLVPYMALYEGRAGAVMPAIFAKDLMHWGNDLTRNGKIFSKIAGAARNDIGFCIQANGELSFTEEACRQFDRLMRVLYPTPSSFEKAGGIPESGLEAVKM